MLTLVVKLPVMFALRRTHHVRAGHVCPTFTVFT